MQRHTVCVFFFHDTATTEIYTLSLHDALPISRQRGQGASAGLPHAPAKRADISGYRDRSNAGDAVQSRAADAARSEEHTSELQSHSDLVCRLLLEKKKQTNLIHKGNHQDDGRR